MEEIDRLIKNPLNEEEILIRRKMVKHIKEKLEIN